jgi:acyl-CoA synthetase (AMP-forming)/AMP-acid ligase II
MNACEHSRLDPADLTSLVDLLRRRAAGQPADRAYAFLSDRAAEEASLTFAELERRANGVAARLAAHGRAGERALLVFPPGLDFLVGFFGCLIAGVIAVPMMPPRRAGSRDGSAAIIGDSQPHFVLSTPALVAARPDVVARYRDLGLEWIVVDPADSASPPPSLVAPRRDDIAFLQYTSGSTSAPKGVVVSHGNLLANLEMMRVGMGLTRSSTSVSWVPLYHDMGLIHVALGCLYAGALCVLMSPRSFVHRPMNWLRAIHQYRAEVACAPNFGFDLCVSQFRPDQVAGIDLSCLKLALNAAEPVRASSLERFASTFHDCGLDASAFYIAYGLAEATLFVSGGRVVTHRVSRETSQTEAAAAELDGAVVVGCGRSILDEPHRHRRPADMRASRPRHNRRGLGKRSERGAGLLAQSSRQRDDVPRLDCRRRRRAMVAYRRPRFPR